MVETLVVVGRVGRFGVMDMALVGVGAGSCLHSQRPQLLLRRSAHQRQLGRARRIRVAVRARALSDIAEASQVVQSTPDLTWQIWAGAIGELCTFLSLNCGPFGFFMIFGTMRVLGRRNLKLGICILHSTH